MDGRDRALLQSEHRSRPFVTQANPFEVVCPIGTGRLPSRSQRGTAEPAPHPGTRTERSVPWRAVQPGHDRSQIQCSFDSAAGI